MYPTMHDVKAKNTVDKIAFRSGGSKASALLNCAVGGRMRLNTATEAMTRGSGTATSMLGFHAGGRAPAVCPTRPIESGSGMFLFVLGKCHRPVARSFFRVRPSRASSHQTLII